MSQFKYLKIIFFFVVIYGIASCTMGEAATQTQTEKEIVPPISSEMQELISDYSNFIQQKINERRAPIGFAVGIVKDGNVLLEKGFGFRDVKTKTEVNANTVFRIASLSKAFAGGLAGTLVRDQQIKWETKLDDILPDLKLHNQSYKESLELQHILSQTTGMPRHTFGNLIEADVSLDKMLNSLKNVKPIAQPGEVLSYQNVVFSLVDPMLEKVTGKTYAELMKEQIYDPLNMQDASTDFASIVEHPNFAFPHRRNNSRMRLDSAYYSVLPAAGVNASISDMNQWLLAMLGHQPEIFSEDLLSQITSKRIILPKNNPWSRAWEGIRSVGYGFGWRVVDYKGLELIYHGGLVNGYRAEIAFCPENDIGIVLLSNSKSGMFFKSVPTFFDMFLSRQILNSKDLDKKKKKDLQN